MDDTNLRSVQIAGATEEAERLRSGIAVLEAQSAELNAMRGEYARLEARVSELQAKSQQDSNALQQYEVCEQQYGK